MPLRQKSAHAGRALYPGFRPRLIRFRTAQRLFADRLARPNIWMIAAEFITLEARCCPFLSFSCKLKQKTAQCRCGLPGRPGVKEFLCNRTHFEEELEAGKPVSPPVQEGEYARPYISMRYWLSKAGPGERFSRLASARTLTRGAQAPARSWLCGDRLVFWEGSPELRVVGSES